MKKNVMMRIAAAMVVLTLLTTCVISSTFAKYTTSATLTDKARVAKWGVAIEVSGDIFTESYNSDNVKSLGAVAEVSHVVAPNTNGSVTFSVSGTPEVAFDLAVSLETGYTDVYLKEKTGYPDYTVSPAGTFDLDADYYPVKFTLKKGTATLVDKKSLADVATALSGTSVSKTYTVSSTTIADTYTLSWEWAASDNDKADTLLGNIAAGTVTGVDAADYSLTVGFTLKIEATQTV